MKLKKRLFVMVFGLLMLFSFSTVEAKTNTHNVTVKLLNTSITAKLKATYYTSGNTRWAASWTLPSPPANLKGAMVTRTKFDVESDKILHTGGKISATDFNYNSASVTKNYKVTYSSGSIKFTTEK